MLYLPLSFSLKLNDAKHDVETSLEKLKQAQTALEGLEKNLIKEGQNSNALKAQITGLESNLAVSQEKCNNSATNLSAVERRIDESQGMNEELRLENSNQKSLIKELQVTIEKERQTSREKLEILDESKEKLSEHFKVLASEVLEKNSKSFAGRSEENLSNLLKPLSTKIEEFEKKVGETYEKEARDRTSLQQEIKHLTDLNQKMTKEAHNLVNALKGETKTQGNWGEMILERILEASGLTKGREYLVQESLTTEEGKRYQPDVIINLPEEKQIIIDSKVSLVAYERYCSSSDDTERADALKAHVLSLRNHVRELSDKKYQNLKGLKTLDFVLLFVPVEPAFALAVQSEQQLFTEAISKNIVIVTPSTLLATLRTVAHIWRQEAQNKNAEEIARHGGALYDKFCNFINDMEKMGAQLQTVNKTYDGAMSKLSSGRGNLVRQTERLRELGAKTSKKLNIEAQPELEPLD